MNHGDLPHDLLYTYCFTTERSVKLGDISDIAGGTDCFLLEEGRIGAVVSPVDPDQFGEEAMAALLKDSEWLKQKVQAHEHVIEQVMANGPVIPLKFGTIFRGERRITDFLAANEQALGKALDRLTGVEEWSLKLFYAKEQFTEAIKARNKKEENDLGLGAGYLQRKRQEKILQEEAGKTLENLAQELFDQLKGFSESWAINECLVKEITGRQEEMVLNIAFLLQISQVTDFCRAIDAFEARVSHLGIIVEASGPWPPYHFSDFPEESHE